MMKYLFLIFLCPIYSSIAIGQETSAPTSPEEVSDVGTVELNSNEDEQALFQNEQFNNCRTQYENVSNVETRTNQIRDCIQQQLNQSAANQAPTASPPEEENQTHLNNYQVNESKTTQEMNEYLSKRFEKSINGRNFNATETANFKDKKFVNQRTYFELYRSQLQKNIFLSYSSYCLENLRINNQAISPRPCSDNQSQYQCQGPNGETLPPALNGNMTDLEEVEYVAGADTGNNADTIQRIVNDEIQKGSAFLEAKYTLCLDLTKKLCNTYKCSNNAQDSVSCADTINSAPAQTTTSHSSPSPTQQASQIALVDQDSANTKGRIACTVISNVKVYRDNLSKTESMLENELKVPIDEQNIGFDVTSAFKGYYNGNAQGENQKSIDQITTLSSQELTSEENIESYANIEQRANDLRQECENQNPNSLTQECRNLLSDRDERLNIQVEFEAATVEEDQRLRSLVGDRENLIKYLRENGMTNIEENLNNYNETELAEIISNRFRSERMAVINRLNERLKNREVNNNDSNISTQIGRATDELKEQKDRIGAVIQYNNIITSFITIEQRDENGAPIPGTTTERNSVGFIAEREATRQNSDDTNQDLERFFNSNEELMTNTDSNSPVTLRSEDVDQILGNSNDSNSDESNGN